MASPSGIQQTASPQPIKPWKELGYRAFSNFLASDDAFLIFRRFGVLNVRVLLFLQDQIVQLEERLASLDEIHSARTAPDIDNGTFRKEPVPERTQILEDLHTKLKEYNDLLLQHSTLRSHPKVPILDLESLRNWLNNTQSAITPAETTYVHQTHDLIPLIPKKTSPLRRFLEQSSRFRLAKIWRKPTPANASINYPFADTLTFTSDTRIDRFIEVVITVLGMIMLISPLWILACTKGTFKRLGVITGFIVLFLGLVAYTSAVRPFESLAAAAA